MNSYKLILLPSLLILITSCGGGGGSSSDSSAPNTAPELTGTTEFAIDENTTDVSTFQANDAQNDSIHIMLKEQIHHSFQLVNLQEF